MKSLCFSASPFHTEHFRMCSDPIELTIILYVLKCEVTNVIWKPYAQDIYLFSIYSFSNLYQLGLMDIYLTLWIIIIYLSIYHLPSVYLVT